MSPVVLGLSTVLLVFSSTPGVTVQQEPDQRLYERALDRLDRGEVDAALEELVLLVERFPDSELADEALLRVAQLRADRGDTAGAMAAAERVAADYPRSGAAAGASVLSVQIRRRETRSREGLEDLRDELNRVPVLYDAGSYPTIPWRAAARVVAGEISLELSEPEQATGHFDAALRERPGPQWQQRARVGFGRALLALGSWQEAARLLQETVAAAGDGASGGSVSEDSPAREARRILGTIHRLIVRPEQGQSPWQDTRRIRGASTAFEDPIGVAATESGVLLIADEDAPLVALLEPSGRVRSEHRPMSSNGRPWFGADGAAYVPTRGSVMVPQERRRETFTTPNGDEGEPVRDLRAGTRSRSGDWILVHEDGERITAFSPDGAYARTIQPLGRTEVVDAVLDGRERLYLLDRERNAVLRYSAAGEAEGAVMSADWDRPQALDVDVLGNVYVLDRDRKRIDVFGPDGARRASVGPGMPGGISLGDPRDIAVDGSGRLYVADRDLAVILVLE